MDSYDLKQLQMKWVSLRKTIMECFATKAIKYIEKKLFNVGS